jgi:hypothetical protein
MVHSTWSCHRHRWHLPIRRWPHPRRGHVLHRSQVHHRPHWWLGSIAWGERLGHRIRGHGQQGVTNNICHPRGVTQRGWLNLEWWGEIWFSYTSGVQRIDLGHPQCYYVATGGNPDASDQASGAVAEHQTSTKYQTPPQATADLLSHHKISISECEPFSQKKFKFSKWFHYFNLKRILLLYLKLVPE